MAEDEAVQSDAHLRAWLEVIVSGRYNLVADKLARRALAGEPYIAEPPKSAVCSICGLSEGDPD